MLRKFITLSLSQNILVTTSFLHFSIFETWYASQYYVPKFFEKNYLFIVLF